jgi:hypothetical protein
LTEIAEAFFARRGFDRLARERAPPAIRSTQEFGELCAASCALMYHRLPCAWVPRDQTGARPNTPLEVRSVPLKLRPTETVEDKGHRSVDL